MRMVRRQRGHERRSIVVTVRRRNGVHVRGRRGRLVRVSAAAQQAQHEQRTQ